MLGRLRSVGVNAEELLDVYQNQIQSVLEMAVAVWEPGLSQAESKQLERVQKSAFNIILGEEYESYDNALALLNSEMLSARRKKLALNFAKKSLKHDKYQNWFSVNSSSRTQNTRAEQTVLKPVYTRTDSYRDSPLPYLTTKLNEYLGKKKNV